MKKCIAKHILELYVFADGSIETRKISQEIMPDIESPAENCDIKKATQRIIQIFDVLRAIKEIVASLNLSWAEMPEATLNTLLTQAYQQVAQSHNVAPQTIADKIQRQLDLTKKDVCQLVSAFYQNNYTEENYQTSKLFTHIATYVAAFPEDQNFIKKMIPSIL